MSAVFKIDDQVTRTDIVGVEVDFVATEINGVATLCLTRSIGVTHVRVSDGSGERDRDGICEHERDVKGGEIITPRP